jgi:16S rRNA (adenine(1408)-N(1))-methyltransferase
MEIIRGKRASFIDASALAERLTEYDAVHIDVGTGDGRFVQHVAQTCPNCLVVGIDACRENLREVSRRAPANALFVIANAQALPVELYGLAAQVTINFPWGSLLEGLLANDPALLTGLATAARPDAGLEVRLNGGALTEAGWSLEDGADRIREVLAANGFAVRPPIALAARELRSCPTTWAKRLAFGRDPRAVYLRGARKADIIAGAAHSMPAANPDQGGQLMSEWKAGDRFILRSGRAVGTVIGVGKDAITVRYDDGRVAQVDPLDILKNVKPPPDPEEDED